MKEQRTKRQAKLVQATLEKIQHVEMLCDVVSNDLVEHDNDDHRQAAKIAKKLAKLVDAANSAASRFKTD
jgi:uncharacterized protein Yka (UPF0111/DUF47 family)